MRPRKPFMIAKGDDFALLDTYAEHFRKWVDWDGTRFATKEEAEQAITRESELAGATVIEIIQKTRVRV